MLNADALNQLRQLKTDIKEHKVVYPGTVKATNGRFGFVALDEGRDVFLPPEEMQKSCPATVSPSPKCPVKRAGPRASSRNCWKPALTPSWAATW